jgi:hypothetical protein
VTIVPPNVSTSSSGIKELTSSEARQSNALIGIFPSFASLFPQSESFIPPVFPVKKDTGPSSFVSGSGSPRHPDKKTAVNKIVDFNMEFTFGSPLKKGPIFGPLDFILKTSD